MSKLSASALSTFLRSPKSYYFRYVAQLEPSQPQVATFDHDKLLGSVWAAYTDRFYRGVSEAENSTSAMDVWLAETEGWVPEKARAKLTTALENLMPQYYQQFSPEDGVRSQGSELFLENETFLGYLDGLGNNDIIHEVKTTSRSPQIAEQLWKIGHSIQVKLYCVLADAAGYQLEIGFKDPPHAILRAPVVTVSAEQKAGWAHELDALAERIKSLGDDPHNYPCHPDNCCLTTRGMVSMCGYRDLCDGIDDDARAMLYKTRERRK